MREGTDAITERRDGMSTYENTSNLSACREALTLIANRHNLRVYFDFAVNVDILYFLFSIGECQILKGSIDLSEEISYHGFELFEKEIEGRIEDLRNKLNYGEGEFEMKKDEKIKELYTSRVMDAIREKYREAGTKQDKLSRRHEEILRILESDEGCDMSWGDHKDLEAELSDCRRERDELKIIRDVWRQARELCMDIADEMAKED